MQLCHLLPSLLRPVDENEVVVSVHFSDGRLAASYAVGSAPDPSTLYPAVDRGGRQAAMWTDA